MFWHGLMSLRPNGSLHIGQVFCCVRLLETYLWMQWAQKTWPQLITLGL